MRLTWRSLLASSASYTTLVLLAILAAFPLFWLFSSALRPPQELFVSPLRLFPSRIDLASFQRLFWATPFLEQLRNSVLVSLTSVALSLAVASLAAYGLTLRTIRGREVLSRLVLLTYLFPSILLLAPLYIIISSLGLADTLSGLIITYTTFSIPFALWMLRAYFATLPTELTDAARVDGAGDLQVLIRIVLPLASPGIATAGIFSFIHNWNEFLFALVFISSAEKKTVPVALYGFVSGFEPDEIGALLAGASLFALPTLLMFVLFQRLIVSGLTAGATKG